MEKNLKKPFMLIAFLKCMLFSYILTGIALFILALLLYKLKLTESTVSIGIIIIYIVASFFVGFVSGRKAGTRKFLWGLMMGAAYFFILTVVSFVVNRSVEEIAKDFLTTFLICAGSGMLGGMLS